MLSQLTPVILGNQGKGVIAGFSADRDQPVTKVKFGEYEMTVSFELLDRYAVQPEETDPRGGGIIIQLGKDDFIIAGSGLIVTFRSLNTDRPFAGILSIDEGRYDNGVWTPGRRLNGDQSHQGRHVRLPYRNFGIQHVILYQYH